MVDNRIKGRNIMNVIAVGTGRCGTKTMTEFFKAQGWSAHHCKYGAQSAEDHYNVSQDMGDR